MPPVPSILGCLKLEVAGQIGGTSDWANIFHIGQAASGFSLANIESIASTLNSTLNALYVNSMGTAVTVDTLTYTDLTGDSAPRYEISVGWTGTRSGISAQASACVLASYQIGQIGR